MKTFKIKLLFIFMIVVLSSCVGTVDDKNAQNASNQSLGNVTSVATFDGLVNAIPVSQDKVELYFRPADGVPANLIYEIYVNNAPIPIKITGNSLSINASGLYIFTVTALTMNSTYTFNMRAVIAGTNEPLKLDPAKAFSATTFKNETADFLGISSLTLGAGESGRDTVKVKWVPASIQGTNINPRLTDPVAYEITYITKASGAQNINNPNYAGVGKNIITIPYPIGNPPALSKDSEYTVAGLTPGETYYFQVRAIHKGYILYKSDQTYMREQNTRFLKVTTLNSAGLFDFNDALVNMTNPLGEAGLTNLNVSWIPAGGEFKQYRLCWKKVANPNDIVPIADYLVDSDLDTLMSNTNACIPINANATSYTLPSLTSYAYYQAKVIACRTFDCALSDRIKSSLMQKRVIANVAPFNGVLTIANPSDVTKLKEIKISFDSPVVSAGFLNQFKLYCYSSSTDTDPVALPTDGSISTATGKPSCDGIEILTPMPTALADFATLNNLDVRLPVIDGAARYCFSLLPSIYSPFLNQEDRSTAVIKCVTPEIKTPTIVQFPGRTNSCNLIGKDLNITWPSPTGGLYTKFVVLYREKQTGSNFFNFPDAISAYVANNSTSYKWNDTPVRDDTGLLLTSLIQGRTYNIGVLPYLEDGAIKRFAQYNVNIGECTLPLPTPTFTEWVDIFAIGPKEDGLTPPTNTNAKKYLLETLDDDGIPVELATTIADARIPDTVADPLAVSRSGSTQFNGVYGSMGATETNPLYQYSNSGIVKIAWKDVSFYSDTMKLNSFITNPLYEKSPGVKSQRKFGYKVYRSDDNQMTWLDLTKNSATNKFQTISNSGLLHPANYSWKARNNASTNTEQITFFTDYSVKFSGSNEEVDRARIYFYKIVPVFDGKELGYGDNGNSTHHIIKVTLPPRNMALVHRMMANRTICLEMDKQIDTSSGMHYSCEYNGLGASGLSLPWAQGNTVYDIGGDLLIDRFELSCPFTRGDQNFVNSDSSFNADKPLFTGHSTTGGTFKGCYNNNTNSNNEPVTGSTVITANYNYKQVIPGDCFGNEDATPVAMGVCANPLYPNTHWITYPGSSNWDLTPFCTDSSWIGDNVFNLVNPASRINTDNDYFPTQSEFAAVYYSRSSYGRTSDYNLNVAKYPGGSGKEITQSTSRSNNGSCYVNLNWVNSTGNYKPRWMPVNTLLDRLNSVANPSGLNLYNKTISTILSHPDLYDATAVKAPASDLLTSTRYKATSTLARVVTSNSAKLPPLEGIDPKFSHLLCGTYKVQVGLETASKGFLPASNKIYSKRLMRKKESVVAAAWPQTYDGTKTTDIEGGTYVEGTIEKGCNTKTKTTPMGTSQFHKANYITNSFPHSDEVHPSVMVGSSSRDFNGNAVNTEKCVSRFGIQDIVGNLREANSEQIFCDFAQDKLYLGLSKNVTQSVLFENAQESSPYDPNAVVPWVQSLPSSGSCSVVENGGSRSGNYLANGNYLASIYDFLGNLSNSVVTRGKDYDQDSILADRNGDGSFLDFGQNNIAPKLSKKDSLATIDDNLSDGVTPDFYANYFNVALGMPLLCDKGCAGEASDNTLISSNQICSTKSCPALTPAPVIQNFPMNNSRFFNYGTGDINIITRLSSLDPNSLPFNYISGITTDPDPSLNALQWTTATTLGSVPGAAPSAYFTIPRGASLKMYTGGMYKENSGRYSLTIKGNSPYWESAFDSQGTRCAVLINQED